MSTENDAIYAQVVEAIEKGAVLQDVTLTAESSLEELEIDSLDITNIAFEIEDRFGIELEEADLADLKTVADLVAIVRSRTATA